jgi:hypothetical protein
MRTICFFASTALLASSVLLPVSAATKDVVATQQEHRDGSVVVRVAPPTGTTAGWQPVFRQNVPTGEDLIFSYKCPTGTTPLNGSFYPNAAARTGLSLVGNYRLRAQAAWGWAFNWPNGAPAGSAIVFDVYCLN